MKTRKTTKANLNYTVDTQGMIIAGSFGISADAISKIKQSK